MVQSPPGRVARGRRLPDRDEVAPASPLARCANATWHQTAFGVASFALGGFILTSFIRGVA